MPPFDNDWMSSLFLSLDPVAIESVGFDFLRAEFTAERGLGPYPQMDGVDDYLHQAADSSQWPAGIVYDPDGDGTPLSSLGVHEHWNNPDEKQYSRNLGSGAGIELVVPRSPTFVADDARTEPAEFRLFQNYPNPFNPVTTLSFTLPEESDIVLALFDVTGREVEVLAKGRYPPGTHRCEVDGRPLASGIYLARLISGSQVRTTKLACIR